MLEASNSGLQRNTASEKISKETKEISNEIAQISDALGDPTRRGIYIFVRENDGVSASDVALRFTLHPNVARHHLDKLVSWGYLESSTAKLDSKAGRPSKKYKGSSKIPSLERERRQFELMAMLLSKTLDAIELDKAEKIAFEVGQNYGKSIADQMQDKDLLKDPAYVIAAIADALSAHGFVSHKVTESKQMVIVNEICPFGAIALEHPVLCAVERGIVSGLLYHSTTHRAPLKVSSKALGDVDCSVNLTTSR